MLNIIRICHIRWRRFSCGVSQNTTADHYRAYVGRYAFWDRRGGNWLDSTMLTISPDLRQLALIVILVKAGLAINLRDIWSLGRPLLMMSTVPMLIELTILTYLGLYVFGLHGLEALLWRLPFVPCRRPLWFFA
mgnify:CR=1 FL=1